MKQIYLKGKTNQVAIVDNDDYPGLSQYKWYNNKGYAIRITSRKDGHKVIKMHREIMGALDTTIPIDHIDRNKLNNQKSNLRLCTASQNAINTGLNRNNTSGTKGVYWHRNRQKWQVFVKRNNKVIYIGLYADKQHAICARQAFTK